MTVPRAVALRKELADNRFAGQRRQCDRGDKLFSGRSDYYLHFCPFLYEQTGKHRRFISSYAPRYA